MGSIVNRYSVVGAAVVLVGGGLFLYRSRSTPRVVEPAQVADAVADLERLGVGESYGAPDASVRVVEIFDFECPACAEAHEATKSLIERHINTGIVSFTAFNVPIPSHKQAVPAALIARCVGRQDPDSRWEFRDELFQRRSEWLESYPVEDALLRIASGFPVDTLALRQCVRDSAEKDVADMKTASAALVGHGLTYIPLWAVENRVVTWTELEDRIRDVGGVR